VAGARLTEGGAEQRIVWLDVLRGASLFGIAQINFPSFAAGQLPVSSLYGEQAPLSWHMLYGAITLLITAKFYPIFAFLFGYGHALQRERLLRQGFNVQATLMRRYGALLLFGMAHGSLLFFGDILTMYALAGMLLLAESGRHGPGSNEALLRWAVISVALGAIWGVGLAHYPASIHADWVRMHNDDLLLLAGHDWRSIAAGRASLYLSAQLEQLASFLPELMLFMNAGAWACRHGVLQQPQLHRALFKRCVLLGVVIGLPVNVTLMLLELKILDEGGAPVAVCAVLDNLAFFLSVGYLGLLGLYAAASPTSSTDKRAGLVAGLAALGRVALTNYVVQSLAMMAIWYLCWHQVSLFGAPLVMASLALLVCLMQMLWALRHTRLGRQGPLETIWRRITYAHAPGSI
jgi:uncharacterized protein